VSCETVLRWHRSCRLPGGHRLNGSNVLRFDESAIEMWAEAMLVALHYEGSVAALLAAHGYGPGRASLNDAFLDFKGRSSDAS
jgi:hypothetical protein